MKKVMSAGVGLVTLLSCAVLAQSTGAPAAFEVAAIRPAPPSTQRMPRIRLPPSGLVEFEGSLRDLVAIALDISPNVSADLMVGPPFMESARFNIAAKVPRREGDTSGIPLSAVRPLLRALFVERFKLATHREEREITAYALVAPKGASKLKQADGSQPASCRATPGALPAVGRGNPPLAFTCQNTTMTELSHNLQRWANVYFDHPIVDATDLKGGWDFVVGWTPLSELRGPSAPADPTESTAAAADPGGLTVFEAVERQLGLKLKKEKRRVSVVIIDHIEQKPTESATEAEK